MVLGEHYKGLFYIIPALILLCLSLYTFYKGREGRAAIVLTLALLAMRLYMAQLDPFVNEWDERFHALVARNLMKHPLKPTLYDNPALPSSPGDWANTHIWLHKPPLALWQIAVSYTIFGVSAFKARLPMVLLGSLLALLIYRMGALAINRKTGYIAAFLYAVSYYQLSFASGMEATDHVDFSFLFYITASLWAWMEYYASNKLRWIWLIGLAAGLAVLTKFLPGVLVYGAWGIVILSQKDWRGNIYRYAHLLGALLLSVAIFLPWQLYAAHAFPDTAHAEMQYNFTHLFKAVEGHEGPWYYYLNQLKENYGLLAPLLIIPALAAFYAGVQAKAYRIFLLSSLISVYVFFSLSATKMPAYCYIMAPIMFIIFGALAYAMWKFFNPRPLKGKLLYVSIAGILIVSVLSMNPWLIKKRHTGGEQNAYWANCKALADYARDMVDKQVPDDYVLFGAPFNAYINVMYYTGNTTYGHVPDEKTIADLKAKGKRIGVFTGEFTPQEPDFILKDSSILKIPFVLKYY